MKDSSATAFKEATMIVGIVVFLASLLLVIGIILNGIILFYLSKKTQLQKTSLDVILTETLMTHIMFLVDVYMGLVFGLVLTDISYPVLIGLTAFSALGYNIHGIFVITMMSTKIAFLLFPSKMLERSDSKVWREVMIARIALFLLVIILNTATNAVGSDPHYFQMIQPSDQYQCPKILRVGPGNGFVLSAIFGLTIYAEFLAFRGNEHQAEKPTIKIAVVLAVSAWIVACPIYVMNAMGYSTDLTHIYGYIVTFYVLLAFSLLLPLLIISRTPNLSEFTKELTCMLYEIFSTW